MCMFQPRVNYGFVRCTVFTVVRLLTAWANMRQKQPDKLALTCVASMSYHRRLLARHGAKRPNGISWKTGRPLRNRSKLGMRLSLGCGGQLGFAPDET